MTKVLILYYSAYGHTERMAQAVAEGVREAGADADIKRVPELVPERHQPRQGCPYLPPGCIGARMQFSLQAA